MFRRLSLVFLAVAMFAVARQQVHGSLIMLNDPSIDTAIANGQFGVLSAVSSNGFNLTFDNETNLEWLDVSVTRGLSPLDVTTLMATGGVLDGFRYATTAELTSFMNKNGVTVPLTLTGTPAEPKIANAQAFNNIWGGNLSQIIEPEFNTSLTYGLYSTSAGTVGLFYGTDFFSPYYEAFSLAVTFVSREPDVGHALVRTPIPEPSSLLFSGLAGYILQGIRFRRAVV